MGRTRVAVVGAGPLGAAAARELAVRSVPDVVLLDGDDAGDGGAYRSSGGSICWYRPDPVKAELIRQTAEHLRRRVADGAAIRLRELPYLLLDRGVLVPALNVDSADVVADLVAQARDHGAQLERVGRVGAVSPRPGGWRVEGDRGDVDARVVLLALGAGNVDLVPGLPRRLEKRQLFVLDLPVDDDRARMPHVVARVGGGHAYVFVKELPEGRRVLLGQEDLMEDRDLTGPSDHFTELLDAGVGRTFGFLREGRPERILWGVDWADKLPAVTTGEDPTLLAVNCGSGVRACIPAGRAAADAVDRALMHD